MARDLMAALKPWNSHDVEGILAFYRDDLFFEDVALKQTCVGKPAFRQLLQGFFALFSDIHIKLNSFIDVEDMAVGEWVMTGVRTDTGQSFSIRIVVVYEVEEGKVKRHSMYYNPFRLLQAGIQ